MAQQEALQKNLDAASAKLAAARLGENLEKDQQSEKLEVIEQPTVPQEPIKPNRPKVAALAVLMALDGGRRLGVLVEISDKGIRRSSDIFSIVDNQLDCFDPLYRHVRRIARRSDAGSLLIICVLAGLGGRDDRGLLLLAAARSDDRQGAGRSVR